jgi:tetratricopeptide (TPR) repeat protein
MASALATKTTSAPKSWVCACVLVLITLLAYQPVWRAGFIWDDDMYVTDNSALRGAEGLRQIWINPSATPQYYPLTFTAFWIEHLLWDFQPFGFHLVNVLLHAANALLFWRLLSRLRVAGAWWAAAVFALHPVHVMSVAWVTELKNVLSGFFFLAALRAYLRYCEPDDDGIAQSSYRRWAYKLALALYLCALLSKTSTSIMPVAMLLILWWKKERLGRKELAPLAPFFVMGILFGAFTLWLERYVKGASGQEFALPFLDRFLVAGRSFWFCLGKLIWPVRLTFIYPRWQIDSTRAGLYLFPLGAVVLLVLLWRLRYRIGRAPLAALAYFTLAFPALVLVQVLYMMRYTFVSDHWQYLGSLSVIALGVSGAELAFDRWAASYRRIWPAVGMVVLAALGLLTWQQTRIYYNRETLWRDTITKNPQSSMAHANLGDVFLREGKNSDAIGCYEEALRIAPGVAVVHSNLGIALARLGKTQAAMEHYEQALRIEPNFAVAHCNLGIALAQAGRIPEAIDRLQEALRIEPGYAEAHCNLGVVLAQVGRIPEAIEHLQQALRIKPDYAEAHYNLGVALARLGRLPEVVAQWKEALRLKPDYAEVHCNLGTVLVQLGKIEEAIAHYEQALRIKPGYAEAYYNLGVALTRLGRQPEAVGHYEEALRSKPDYAEAENNLAWLLATLAPADGGNPVRAVTLAERACELTNNRAAESLDTLAVAYAAAGRFNDAIAAARKAIGLARSTGQTRMASEIESRLDLYQAGRPYREAATVTSPHGP